MYIAVKGGEQAIAASQRLLDAARRGDAAVPEMQVQQLREQLGLLVDRVMAEASLYDPSLAALAIKQALGDVTEAVFLLRAYRTTLPRFGFTQPVDTRRMRAQRRVSGIFKDIPGGQLLGATFDYTQRLLDFGLMQVHAQTPQPSSNEALENLREAPFALSLSKGFGDQTKDFDRLSPNGEGVCTGVPKAHEAGIAPLHNPIDALTAEGLIEACHPSEGDPEPLDITRDPPVYPLPRTARLQMMARADEGWVLGMAYSTQRGYANSHPFAGEIRHGAVPLEIVPEELGFAIEIGEIELTDCQMINQFVGSSTQPAQFTRGQGLVMGHGERKAMAMSLVDRVLRFEEFDELPTSPAQMQEFVLPHGDNVEASGFVQHLKLPHYVTFESELQLIRALRGQASDGAHTSCAGLQPLSVRPEPVEGPAPRATLASTGSARTEGGGWSGPELPPTEPCT
ncbi:MAG: carbon-phosphorus lyase complex subunit PhnI [Rhizobacter sp.]